MNDGPFKPTIFYDDTDEELDLIATRSMRAQWRHRRVGPKYAKFGRRVKYLGAHLNAWIDKNTIQTNEVA
ncbi:MerR family transcriptional regulator [Ruegeria sp. SCPT10]|uniref:MerR family transcriptional regulator n=1 Tax=Ruegeria sp. SCP10 TaxID=3141377 RepID=UPI00333CC163